MAIRSPGYPSIDLQEALEKAEVLYKHDKRNATSTAVVAEHWNYRPTSSGAKLALAALKKFGLLDAVRNKKSGQVKLSELALRIIQDQRESSPDRDKAIKVAALNPDIHRELWSKWGTEMPSDATMATHLVMEKGFNDATVRDFLREYKATIEFAKLGPNDKISKDEFYIDESAEPEVKSESADPLMVQVGLGASRGADVRGRMLALPLPLIGGGMASLSVPIPLSEENFDYLTSMLSTMLQGMKKAIVSKSVQGGPADDAAANE